MPENSNTVRTTMKTKMATNLTMSAVSSSRFLKLLTRFHKKSTHRSLPQPSIHQTWKIKTHKSKYKHSLVRMAAARVDEKAVSDPWLSHPNLYKSRHHFRKLSIPLNPAALDEQNPEKSSPTGLPRATTRRHRLAMTRGLILQICANLLMILENWLYHGLWRP